MPLRWLLDICSQDLSNLLQNNLAMPEDLIFEVIEEQRALVEAASAGTKEARRTNPYVYREYENVPTITVYFKGCERYRVTPVNDHGWYDGQCRFSGLAPSWGEFYVISGNTRDDMESTPWIMLEGSGTRHFHFYLRDEALEVKALDWSLETKS